MASGRTAEVPGEGTNTTSKPHASAGFACSTQASHTHSLPYPTEADAMPPQADASKKKEYYPAWPTSYSYTPHTPTAHYSSK